MINELDDEARSALALERSWPVLHIAVGCDGSCDLEDLYMRRSLWISETYISTATISSKVLLVRKAKIHLREDGRCLSNPFARSFIT